SGSAVAAGSGSAKPAAGSGSGSAVAAGSGSAKPAAGSGSGSAVAAGSGSAKGSAAGSGSSSAVAAGSGSGSAATPPPPVEMVETTRRREFPLGDNGDKLIKAFTEARAVGELGKPTPDQLVFFKLATKEEVDAKLTEVKKELDAIKAAEADEKDKEKAEEKDNPKDPKDKKKAKKDDKKPELTKKIKELEDQKKAAEKPRSVLSVTFSDGSARTFQVGGSPTQGGSDRYMLDSQSGVVYVFSKEMIANLETGESSLQLTDPRGFDAAKIEQVEVDWNGRKKLAKRVQTADASDKQVKTWTDAETGKANQPLATFIDNVNNLRPTEYAKDVKVDTLAPIFKIEYRDAQNGKLGTLALYRVEKAPVLPDGVDLDPANPPKGEIEYYVLTERTRVPALVRRDPAKKSEEDLPIVFGDKAAPTMAPKPGANPFGNVPIKPHAGSAAPSPLGLPAPKTDPHGH
nr:DUF4340 domain-containing protein [Deltaproteobacteria bacterium]